MIVQILIALCVCGVLYAAWRMKAVKPLPGITHLNPWYPFFGNIFLVLQHHDTLYDWNYLTSKQSSSPWYLSILGREPMLFAPLNEKAVAITKYVLQDNFKNFILPPYRIDIFGELLGKGIFTSNGEVWKIHRKAASHIFTLRNLRDFMSRVFVHHGEIVLKLLEKHQLNKTELDVQKIFFRYTIDSFTEIAFGESTNSLYQEFSPFAHAFDEYQHQALHRMFDPLYKLKRFFGLGKREKLIREYVKTIDTFAKEIIEKRQGDELKQLNRQDLISLYIRAMKEKQEEVTMTKLRDFVMNFLIAGRDTTACCLTWFFYELALHPEVEAKILEEIHRVQKEDEDSKGFDFASKLVFTEAAVLETLRLHPPVPQDGREAVADDTLPDGTPIKKGWQFNFNPYSLNRNETIWGADALLFKPERWYDAEENSIRKGITAFDFPTFSAGPRLCLGKSLAILEAKLLISQILPRYQLRLVQGKKVEYRISIILQVNEGLWMTVSAR